MLADCNFTQQNDPHSTKSKTKNEEQPKYTNQPALLIGKECDQSYSGTLIVSAFSVLECRKLFQFC